MFIDVRSLCEPRSDIRHFRPIGRPQIGHITAGRKRNRVGPVNQTQPVVAGNIREHRGLKRLRDRGLKSDLIEADHFFDHSIASPVHKTQLKLSARPIDLDVADVLDCDTVADLARIILIAGIIERLVERR